MKITIRKKEGFRELKCNNYISQKYELRYQVKTGVLPVKWLKWSGIDKERKKFLDRLSVDHLKC